MTLVTLTPKQIDALHIRIAATCTTVQVRRWEAGSNALEASYFAGTRLIETVKVQPGGAVQVLS